jgi:hypothetical protein
MIFSSIFNFVSKFLATIEPMEKIIVEDKENSDKIKVRSVSSDGTESSSELDVETNPTKKSEFYREILRIYKKHKVIMGNKKPWFGIRNWHQRKRDLKELKSELLWKNCEAIKFKNDKDLFLACIRIANQSVMGYPKHNDLLIDLQNALSFVINPHKNPTKTVIKLNWPRNRIDSEEYKDKERQARNKILQLIEQKRECKKEIDSLKSQITDKSDIEESLICRDKQVQDMKNKLNNKDDKISRKGDKIKKLRNIVDQKDKRIAELEDRCTALEKEIKEMKKSHKIEIEDLRKYMNVKFDQERKNSDEEFKKLLQEKDNDYQTIIKTIHQRIDKIEGKKKIRDKKRSAFFGDESASGNSLTTSDIEDDYAISKKRERKNSKPSDKKKQL